MLNRILVQEEAIYYSYTSDITLSLQKQLEFDTIGERPNWKKVHCESFIYIIVCYALFLE